MTSIQGVPAPESTLMLKPRDHSVTASLSANISQSKIRSIGKPFFSAYIESKLLSFAPSDLLKIK